MDINTIINNMSNNDLDSIILGVKSDIPVLNLNAVIFGTRFNVKDVDFITALTDDLISSKETFFGNDLSSFVRASLDLLGIQPYNGDDDFTKRLIKSNMNFI